MAEYLASLTDEEMQSILNQFPLERLANLPTNWEFWARKDQWPPEGDWQVWLVMAGRGIS
jgi:phage terminase large subunit-like protein